MCNHGVSTSSECDSRTNGANTGEIFKSVRHGYDQKDWDELADRFTFAINTAQDRVRGDTSFYLIHGWNPRSTLETTLSLGITKRRDHEPRRWRYHRQLQYLRAIEVVRDRIRIAIEDRADRHHTEEESHEIGVGSQVWLYLDRVKEGYSRKLAHMWHGQFRVRNLCGRHAVRLEVSSNSYQLFPLIHISKLKRVKIFPDRLDFNEAMLTEDSWECTVDEDEFEVEKIMDVRSGRRPILE